MTHLTQAIQDAVEKGGWDWRKDFGISINLQFFPDGDIGLLSSIEKWHVLMSPAFWRALGVARGWADKKYYPYAPGHNHSGGIEIPEAQWYSKNFWNHIWDGNDIESFFRDLSAQQGKE